MKYQWHKNSNIKFWPFWKLFGLIVKERERGKEGCSAKEWWQSEAVGCGTQGRIPSSKCLATAVPTSAHRGQQKEYVVLRWWPISLGRQGRESWCVPRLLQLLLLYSVLGLKESQDYVRTLHTTVTTAEGTMGLMPF